jgi:2-polyprenyl-3-methyl-5-hydroxy-6-metoxy-1,4-benzoquinol methylase
MVLIKEQQMDSNVLYEAIYIFDKYCEFKNVNENNYIIISNLPANILNATLRILASQKLIFLKDNSYFATQESVLKINNLVLKMENEKFISNHTRKLFEKITQKCKGVFFENISNIEYEIYSRCNFSYSFNIGSSLVKIWDFGCADILDIGGNSGGLATAISQQNPDCEITIVDKCIPCNIGEEFKEFNQVNNIIFIKEDLFLLNLNKCYDFIILSNILHDYNDMDCRRILNVCRKHSNLDTKILIVEDILDNEIEPSCVVEHGLRISINTIEGQQRTVSQLNDLMNEISFSMNKKETINDIQSAIVYGKI